MALHNTSRTSPPLQKALLDNSILGGEAPRFQVTISPDPQVRKEQSLSVAHRGHRASASVRNKLASCDATEIHSEPVASPEAGFPG